MRIITLLYSLILMLSCKQPPKENDATPVYKKGVFDTLFRAAFFHSGTVHMAQNGNTIAVVDKYFCTVNLFDINERKLSDTTYFGLIDTFFTGKSIDAISALPNGGWLLRHNYELWWVTKNMHIEERENILFPSTQVLSDLEASPAYSNPALYEPDFTLPSMAALSSTEFLFPIVAEHPFFNGFNTSAFYHNAYAIASYSRKNPLKTVLIGKRKGIYHDKQFLPTFYSAMACAISPWEVVVGFEADSLLYIYNLKSNKHLTFGNAGISMATSYPLHNELSFAFDYDAQKTEREKYGRYLQLISKNDGKYIARTYMRGLLSSKCFNGNFGVQLYYNTNLYADIIMPNQIKHLSITDSGEILTGDLSHDSIYIFKIKPFFP